MLDIPNRSIASRLAALPRRLFAQQPVHPPHKALILKPCCLSQVLLATPLLAALAQEYPQTRFDWAINEYARPAIATNPRLSELIDTGHVGTPNGRWRDVRDLADRLRQEQYDTCFIPSRSSRLALVAWRAGIPQRIGLGGRGRGLAHTLAVEVPSDTKNAGAIYMGLARALGIEAQGQMEYYPPDSERARITQLLVDEIGWLSDAPLVVLHPGGGQNPLQTDLRKRWPVERFALLGNHLIRAHGARVLLVGGEVDRKATKAIAGMMSTSPADLAGRFSLAALGALCEVADLYVGNDTGPTHVAAAVGCPTLAIFGPSDPARSGPYAAKGPVAVLGGHSSDPFSWENVVPAEEAMDAADRLLRRKEAPGTDATESEPRAGQEPDA